MMNSATPKEETDRVMLRASLFFGFAYLALEFYLMGYSKGYEKGLYTRPYDEDDRKASSEAR